MNREGVAANSLRQPAEQNQKTRPSSSRCGASAGVIDMWQTGAVSLERTRCADGVGVVGHDALRNAEAGSTATTRHSGASAETAPMTVAPRATRMMLAGSIATVIVGVMAS